MLVPTTLRPLALNFQFDHSVTFAFIQFSCRCLGVHRGLSIQNFPLNADLTCFHCGEFINYSGLSRGFVSLSVRNRRNARPMIDPMRTNALRLSNNTDKLKSSECLDEIKSGIRVRREKSSAYLFITQGIVYFAVEFFVCRSPFGCRKGIPRCARGSESCLSKLRRGSTNGFCFLPLHSAAVKSGRDFERLGSLRFDQ